MREDVIAYEGWKHLFGAIEADCQRVASGTNWDAWIKGDGPERIWQEGAWLWNQRGSRCWTWEDWERFQSRSDTLFDMGIRYGGLDEKFEPDAKVKNVWVEVWTQAIADSVGIPDYLGSFIGDSHIWAIQFEKMLPVDRKNLIERGWESCRKNARLAGLTADEVWQYEGLFHREYTGHNVAMGYMNLLALHTALQEEEIERFQDRIQMEKDFGQQTETLLSVKQKADGTIPIGQYMEETPKPDFEPDRNQYATEEDYHHALDGKGGVFYRNEKGLLVSYALQTIKEERGFQLAKAFQDFLDKSGLDFEGNLSIGQCEQALLRVGLPVPDLERQHFGLAGFLNFWKPGKCGDWLTRLWHSGQSGLARLKESGIWDSCSIELFSRYLELELRGESREAENMRCRILTTWAFAVPWCVEKSQEGKSGKQQTETNPAVRPVEMTPLNQGESLRFSWADVRIVFIDDSTLRLHLPGESPKRKTFADAGFSDKRRALPDSQWKLLLDMAEKGQVTVSTRTEKSVKAAMKRIRRRLEEIVGLSDCPIVYDHKERAYRPKDLKIEDKRCGGAGGANENEVETHFRDRSGLPAKSKKTDSVTD